MIRSWITLKSRNGNDSLMMEKRMKVELVVKKLFPCSVSKEEEVFESCLGVVRWTDAV